MGLNITFNTDSAPPAERELDAFSHCARIETVGDNSIWQETQRRGLVTGGGGFMNLHRRLVDLGAEVAVYQVRKHRG